MVFFFAALAVQVTLLSVLNLPRQGLPLVQLGTVAFAARCFLPQKYFAIRQCTINRKLNHCFFIYQNVRITEALTVIPERLRTLVAVTVTVESDLVGFVLRGPPAQECQLPVHLKSDVAQMHPDG